MRFLALVIVAAVLLVSLSIADEKEHGGAQTCTCAVFGNNDSDTSSTEPLLTKAINFVAPCNEQGAKDCNLICKAIAEAGAAAESHELCESILTTAVPIHPTIYSKLCDATEWSYADLTASKAYCCAEGKHVPCPAEE